MVMASSATTKAARRAAREAVVAAQADLARRNRANMDDLAVFLSARQRADAVDDWFNERVAALKAQADERRAGQRRECGIALAGDARARRNRPRYRAHGRHRREDGARADPRGRHRRCRELGERRVGARGAQRAPRRARWAVGRATAGRAAGATNWGLIGVAEPSPHGKP